MEIIRLIYWIGIAANKCVAKVVSLVRAEATIARCIAINPYHTERKSGLGSISLVIGYNAASITKQTKVDIEKSL